jgi:hypothetical protein
MIEEAGQVQVRMSRSAMNWNQWRLENINLPRGHLAQQRMRNCMQNRILGLVSVLLGLMLQLAAGYKSLWCKIFDATICEVAQGYRVTILGEMARSSKLGCVAGSYPSAVTK